MYGLLIANKYMQAAPVGGGASSLAVLTCTQTSDLNFQLTTTYICIFKMGLFGAAAGVAWHALGGSAASQCHPGRSTTVWLVCNPPPPPTPSRTWGRPTG